MKGWSQFFAFAVIVIALAAFSAHRAHADALRYSGHEIDNLRTVVNQHAALLQGVIWDNNTAGTSIAVVGSDAPHTLRR